MTQDQPNPLQSNPFEQGERPTADGLHNLTLRCWHILENTELPYPEDENLFYEILKYCYKLVSLQESAAMVESYVNEVLECTIPYLDDLTPQPEQMYHYCAVLMEFLLAIPVDYIFRFECAIRSDIYRI